MCTISWPRLKSTTMMDLERLRCDGNDPTLFMRADQVEAAWQLLMPVLEVWAESNPRNFPNYAAGSWGSKAADELLAREGHAWRPIA
jgi:glucose-6-phosphate 1-dehydrogenase